MLKILKNLKESLISVIIIVILLCLQAGTDLALPDYTSKIVNIGIQQGGIQNVSPEAIRKEQMENLLLFSTDDEKILNSVSPATSTPTPASRWRTSPSPHGPRAWAVASWAPSTSPP